jgi:hypothetical protein
LTYHNEIGRTFADQNDREAVRELHEVNADELFAKPRGSKDQVQVRH